MLPERQWHRVQLICDSSELYELLNGGQKDDTVTLKIVIKHFTGKSVHLALSSKAEKVRLQDCEHKLTGEKIIKYRRPPLLNNKIYLTLHCREDLCLFKLKYEFETEDDPKTSRLKSSSLKLLSLNKFKALTS
jgi:hypothetical protein